MNRVDTLIIGAGPAGLSLAYYLKRNTLVLEKEDQVGGLCRSITQDGGVFDIGGHSFHTPHPAVNELVQSLVDGGLFTQKREANVFYNGDLIPYPFQKNYRQISDPGVVKVCEIGLRNAKIGAEKAENFEEYILRKFGSGIAEHFMFPYNRKLWALDIKQMSCEWTSERVAASKVQKEGIDRARGQRKPLLADTQVGYPQRGGFDEIYKSFLPHVPMVELNSEVEHIDPETQIAYTTDGRQYQWDKLVSTIPLPELVRIVNNVPDETIAKADQLLYMSLRVEFLLAGRGLNTPVQRIYIANPEIPPHKITFNHNSSAHLRAKPHSAIMAEVSLSPKKPVIVKEIAPRTIAFLCDLGILNSPEDIIWQGHVDVKYAYPIYTHERPTLVKKIKAWMGEHHIYTIGRFGDWEYINSDQCIWKSRSMANEFSAIK